MIDLAWIASQPKPVAIHCPTYHDIMTVLCDINEDRTCRLDEKDIIAETGAIWNMFGETSCVRLRALESGTFDVWYEDRDFYSINPMYILVSIDQVKRKFDLGEIESDNTDLSALFGMEIEL